MISLKMPTLEEDQLISAAAESEPDALPLTDDQISAMVPMPVLRGRPELANEKQLVSIRYWPEVVSHFGASGAGWKVRMDAVLKEYVEAHATGDAKGLTSRCRRRERGLSSTLRDLPASDLER
jgi:uncharacterized protein (DUF4415 family)